MAVLVDTNILLDIYTRDSVWEERSAAAIASSADAGLKAFLAYRRRGGLKTAPFPDFYIGAHPAVEQMEILTRDPKRYSSYFPTVQLIEP